MALGALLATNACIDPSRPDAIAVHEPRDAGVPDRVPEGNGAFEQMECFVQPPEGYAARCGYVTVPEGGAAGADIELGVVVVYSKEALPLEPVVYLEGGPGVGASANLIGSGDFPFRHVLSVHDLVLIDQRGTGYSRPSLDCDLSPLPTDGGAMDALGACREELEVAGVDLATYNTRQNAADVDRVR